MRDFSLDFFSRNVELSNSEKLFINKYKSRPLKNRNCKFEALGLLTYLQMLLFSDSETGFYYDVSGTRFQLLAEELDITNKELKQILDWAFEYSILDKAKYEKHQILTSYKMQEDYSKVLDRPEDRVRAQNINMNFVYQCSFTKYFENALQKYKNALQKRESSQQKTGEETRADEIIQDKNSEIKASNNADSLQKFKNEFPNKKTTKPITVPMDVDLDLLTTKLKESDFLMSLPNCDWAWCIKNYQKIISDHYKNYNSKSEKSTQNYTNRDYSNQDLNGVFDDLSAVEL